MNRKCTLLFSVFLMALSAHATIWRVNNVAGTNANFTTLSAAVAGAAAGDTIHLEPSTQAYGDATISKRLVIISLGSFLAENPGLQASTITGRAGNIALDPGSQGSVLSVVTTGFIFTSTNNITLLRCRIGSSITIGGSSTTIVNCYIGTSITFSGTLSSINISNNIIGGSIFMNTNVSATITYNVIQALLTNAAAGGATTLHNSYVHSNIFNKGTAASFISCTVQNNISASNQLPNENGNVNNVDMAEVFVNPNGNVDNHFALKEGSNPAKTAGLNGTDCGAFGGVSPFVLGLIPPIPSIYKFEVPANPAGNSMQVIISTRSNN